MVGLVLDYNNYYYYHYYYFPGFREDTQASNPNELVGQKQLNVKEINVLGAKTTRYNQVVHKVVNRNRWTRPDKGVFCTNFQEIPIYSEATGGLLIFLLFLCHKI